MFSQINDQSCVAEMIQAVGYGLVPQFSRFTVIDEAIDFFQLNQYLTKFKAANRIKALRS